MALHVPSVLCACASTLKSRSPLPLLLALLLPLLLPLLPAAAAAAAAGVTRVASDKMKPLYREAKALADRFTSFEIQHVYRCVSMWDTW
jgi:hypothetical protein